MEQVVDSAVHLGVTHRSAVDAWECDQMEHLNVRFYGSRFSEAEAFALARVGMAPTCSLDDDMQFAHELRRGAALRVESEHHGGSGFVHRLFDEDRATPAATLHARFVHVDDSADGTGPDCSGEGWIGTGLRVLDSAHCTALGTPSRAALLGLLNQAAVHLGLDRHRLRDGDGRLLTGTAVVACRLRRFTSAAPGTLMALHSRIASCGRTSIRMQHQLTDEATGAVLALAAVTSVFFDTSTRRPCLVPQALRDRAASTDSSTPAQLQP
ncbi:thioesterase family protein [Xanthomonas axonopodis]|uniref:thioesterase family protein n=1 Tax=Xanthomonas axonopodis TaxID=53413 RepID=UPI0035575627